MGRNGNTPVWTKDVLQMKTIKDVANGFGDPIKTLCDPPVGWTQSLVNPGLEDEVLATVNQSLLTGIFPLALKTACESSPKKR